MLTAFAFAFVTGTTRSEQRGCYSSDRPPLDMLVGYEYDCNAATCYCLYEEGTLSHGTYSRCFDSMNTGPIGSGLPVLTRNVGSESRACYPVHTQAMGTMFPSATPVPPPGSNICVSRSKY